ncbi:hypothetical protein H4S06_005602, partial [Coemansia sp. BCRC 34490]
RRGVACRLASGSRPGEEARGAGPGRGGARGGVARCVGVHDPPVAVPVAADEHGGV